MNDNELTLKAKDVKIVTEDLRTGPDWDIYDLRRQIEARQTVKDYIRTEILRLQALLETMTHEIIRIDLKLRDRKPVDEPKQKKYLYKPGTVHQYQLTDGADNSIEGEIVND